MRHCRLKQHQRRRAQRRSRSASASSRQGQPLQPLFLQVCDDQRGNMRVFCFREIGQPLAFIFCARKERATRCNAICSSRCRSGSCDCIRSGSGRGEHALAAARVGCKNESSAAHTSRAQVLKLKSLLSRAEIEKRSLQQQLDLKVRAAAVDTRARRLSTRSLTHVRLLKTRTWPAFATSCCLGWKRAEAWQMRAGV